MTKLDLAKQKFADAREKYLSLVRATRPLSRTARQQEAIDAAYDAQETARFWVSYEDRQERNNGAVHMHKV